MITRLNPANESQSAIISALKADADLIALIPKARIYPQQTPNNPVRPFIKMGAPIVTPIYVDGGDCADFSAAIHCFADATGDAKDARVFSMNIASHIARIINAMDSVSITGGMRLAVHVQQIQGMQDGAPSAWHSFVTFRAEAA